jgi:hypothetical protein
VLHPKLENVTLGLAVQFVDYTLASGEYIDLDWRLRTAIANDGTDVAGRVDASTSNWWDEDAPGLQANLAQLIRYSGDGLVSPARAEIRYHEADPA